MSRRWLIACLLVSGVALSLPVAASKGEKVDHCVDLDASHSLRRSGAQHLYVKNGSEHYRLSFQNGTCGPMAVTSKLKIDTEGAENRICPRATRVIAKGRRCNVNGIELIDADEFARVTRARRH